MTAADLVLAIDIGGTKLAVGLVTAAGEITRSGRVATPAEDAEQIWSALATLIDDVVAGAKPQGVGIGCGGPMQISTGHVSPLNIDGWRNFPLAERVRDRFPGLPLRLHNDAVAMAVGEHWRGAGRGAANLLGIVVSTGVGGGIVIGGRVVSGATGNAGHIGHVTVDPTGPRCECGNVGCVEAIARGPAVVAWAREHGWTPTAGPADGPALVSDAQRGEPVALAALQRCGEAVGVACASAAHLLELDRVVVGGGLADGAGGLLLAPARAAFARHAHLDFAARCQIVPSDLSGGAGLIGAAGLVAQSHYVSGMEADS